MSVTRYKEPRLSLYSDVYFKHSWRSAREDYKYAACFGLKSLIVVWYFVRVLGTASIGVCANRLPSTILLKSRTSRWGGSLENKWVSGGGDRTTRFPQPSRTHYSCAHAVMREQHLGFDAAQQR